MATAGLHFAEDKLRDNSKKAERPVVRETYDEIVFWEPTEDFYNRVKQARSKKAPGEADQLMPRYSESTEVNALLAARNRIAQERADMNDMLEAQGL